jgi:hypothetical protein
MYKRITHTIVEEHFDHPLAVEISDGIKHTFKAPLRYYPNGEQISSNLPPSFRVATDSKSCGNCLAFNPTTAICGKWSALVRPEYVCDAWTAISS